MTRIWILAVFCLACNGSPPKAKTVDSQPVDVTPVGASDDSISSTTPKNSSGDDASSLRHKHDAAAVPEESVPQQQWLSDLQHNETQLQKKLRRITHAKVVSFRSKSIKLYFPDGSRAVFKPFLLENRAATYEMAYYRLSEMLGIKGAPVCVMARMYPSRLKDVLSLPSEQEESFWSDVVLDPRGRIQGVLIEWLEDIEPAVFSGELAVIELKKLFNDPERRILAGSVVDMLMLDYVFANWDRFSGGNIFVFKNAPRLALIDHNAAFNNLSEKQNRKLTTYLNLVPSFSRPLLSRLRAMDAVFIEKSLVLPAHEDGGPRASLLRDDEKARILERRDALLSYIEKGK